MVGDRIVDRLTLVSGDRVVGDIEAGVAFGSFGDCDALELYQDQVQWASKVFAGRDDSAAARSVGGRGRVEMSKRDGLPEAAFRALVMTDGSASGLRPVGRPRRGGRAR